MKISNYPEVEALREDDLLVISRPGEGTKSVSIAALAELLAAGVGNTVANNLNTTEEGYILDARQGPEIRSLIDSKATLLWKNPDERAFNPKAYSGYTANFLEQDVTIPTLSDYDLITITLNTWCTYASSQNWRSNIVTDPTVGVTFNVSDGDATHYRQVQITSANNIHFYAGSDAPARSVPLLIFGFKITS